ncbi:uncharacterized protein H6S33_010505 [Morchella sextelata]|uniref:uncharacterized protein n=1 Tax=Morchella sextelata TaxID=1174677 RepID=UPI001D054587|nr:uncharacterized protein H6S33_010505 [Morchella sextelata]KAH0612453.1 hypothetical protein H6S33_010505 [Morchella sextelata]
MSSTGSNLFPSLPLELILLIENRLSKRDLSRLCRTSRTLKHIFAPTLHSRFTADFREITSWAVSTRRIPSLRGILALALSPTPDTANLELELWVRDRLKREVQHSLGSRFRHAWESVERPPRLERRYSPLRHHAIELGPDQIVTEMNFLKLLLAHVLRGDVELVHWLFEVARFEMQPSDLKVAQDVSLLDVAIYRRLKEKVKNVEGMIQLLLDHDPDPRLTCCVRFGNAPPVIWWLDLKAAIDITEEKPYNERNYAQLSDGEIFKWSYIWKHMVGDFGCKFDEVVIRTMRVNTSIVVSNQTSAPSEINSNANTEFQEMPDIIMLTMNNEDAPSEPHQPLIPLPRSASIIASGTGSNGINTPFSKTPFSFVLKSIQDKN